MEGVADIGRPAAPSAPQAHPERKPMPHPSIDLLAIVSCSIHDTMPDISISSLRMKVAEALYDCGGRTREGGAARS